jgi:hypothetical protein
MSDVRSRGHSISLRNHACRTLVLPLRSTVCHFTSRFVYSHSINSFRIQDKSSSGCGFLAEIIPSSVSASPTALPSASAVPLASTTWTSTVASVRSLRNLFPLPLPARCRERACYDCVAHILRRHSYSAVPVLTLVGTRYQSSNVFQQNRDQTATQTISPMT